MEKEETVVQDEAWLPEEEAESQTEGTDLAEEEAELEQAELEQARAEDSAEVNNAATEESLTAKRDFNGELELLLKTYPNALKKGGLPEEVRREAVKGKNVSLAYAEYRLMQLENENRQLRQNAKNIAAAPVKGSGGFNAGSDDFTKGFDSDY